MRLPRLVISALVAGLVGFALPSTQQKVAAAGPVVLAGTFSVVYGDAPPGSGLPPSIRYMLSNGTWHWTLHASEAVLKGAGGAQFLAGKTVEVTGDEVTTGVVVVESIRLVGESALVAAMGGPPMPISGSKVFRTLLCKFADVAAEPQNLAFFDGIMSNVKPGANHYWRELSYDNLNIDGSTQHNWLTLPQNRNQYFVDDDPTKDIQLGELATDCANAHDATVDFSTAHGINFIFNDSIGCCAWGGGIGNTLDGKAGFAATWMPPWSWGTTSHGVLGQEMGHSFGMPHEGCLGTTSPYDSFWDVMSAARQVHINADYKDRIEGWIPGTQKYTATGALNQVIEIRRLALPEPSPVPSSYLMAKIPLPGGPATQYYTLETRKFAGYDQTPQSVPSEAVVIHFVDTTLGDKQAQVVGVPCNGAGAAWVPGELFEDEANNISVAILSETDGGFLIAINPATDVTVSKTATPTPALAGELLTYNITVRNLGPGPATGIVVKDTIPVSTTYDENTLGGSACSFAAGVVTCNVPGTLSPGASITFGIIVRVSASIPVTSGTTTITNTVNVVAAQDDDPTATNNNFSLTTLVITRADLRLTKECKPDQPNRQPAGSPTYCDIFIDNLGPSDARDVVITDQILSTTPITITGYTLTGAGLSCAPATPFGPTSGVTITCTDAVLPAGTRDTIRVNFVADATGDVDDVASVTASTPDPNPDNNIDRGRVSFAATSDLSVTKNAAATAIAGANLTYNVTVTNAGPSPAANVVFRDVLPALVSFVGAAPSTGSCLPGVVPGDPTKPLTCNLGTLAASGPGSSATIAVTVKVNSDVPAGTVLVNNADVSSGSADPNNTNNVASRSTTVQTRADVAVVKTSDAATYKPSSVVTYQITATNNGESKAPNVVVTDNLPTFKQAVYQSDTGGCVLSTPTTLTCNLGDLAVGQSKTFFVYLLVKGSPGDVSNTATVAAGPLTLPDPFPANNASTLVVVVKGGS